MTYEHEELADSTQDSVDEYKGLPNAPSKPEEKGRIRRFVSGIGGILFRNREIPERLARAKADQAEAEVAKTRAEAEVFAQQAREAAARTDQANQKTVKQFFDLVDELGGDSTVSNQLKLAKLIEKNPDVLKQVELIKAKLEELSWKHGTRVQMPEPMQIESDHSSAEEGAEDD